MESEISRLEKVVRERDEQLTSFKTILEEKESLLQQQLEKEKLLTSNLEDINKQKALAQLKITELEERLATTEELVSERETIVTSQKQAYLELDSRHTQLQSELKEVSEHLQEAQSELQEAKTARESFEKELWNKVSEIATLGDQLEGQRVSMSEKDGELARQSSEMEQLKGMVRDLQSSNEVLQSSIDGDRQTAASKLSSSLQQIQELEERVTELQNSLETKHSEVAQLQQLNQQLQNNLHLSEEKLQQSESLNKQEMSKLEMSFGHERETTAESLRELEEKLQEKQAELDLVKESSEKEVKVRDGEISEKQQTIDQLKKDAEAAEKRCSGLQSQLTKTSGALEFAQQVQ